ncbi:radical SAM protein [Clostridiaceae bacterium M8S5]|nr:radical SAM protein [Clostridiaceae bacterium M8S5]
MYPYITQNSRLHYFDNHGILLAKNKRYTLNPVDVYILEKINGKKSISEITKEIALELDTPDEARVKNIIMECINSKSTDILLSDTPNPQSFIKTGIKNKRVPLDIVISLTDKCNCNCVHCFKSCSINGSNSIDYELLIKTLDYLKGKTLNLQLTGGEPMLYDRFFDILKYSIDNFSTTITTTGALINSENIKYFNGISCIQVSLYAENEDKFDKITRSKGSFVNTLNGIKEAVNAGIYVSAACIVKKDNINNIEDIIKLAVDYKIKSLRFGVFIPSGRGIDYKDSWCLSEEETDNLSTNLSTLSDKYKQYIDVKAWASSEQNVDIDDKYQSLSCGSGLYRWFISEKGYIKPCEFIPDEIYAVNNIFDTDISKIIDNYSLNTMPLSLKQWDELLKEKNCTIKDICPVMDDYLKHCV